MDAVIFDALNESAQHGELLLVSGGMCRFHLRLDGQLTITEIIATRSGAGSEMLEILRQTPGATFIFAKCPADLPANCWYPKRGFRCVGAEMSKRGRELTLWRLDLN